MTRDQSDIPKVSPAAVDAITELLIADQEMLRPPTKAAHLLAIICALHEQDRPFPPREAVARAIGGAVSTVDAALSTRIDEGYIEPQVKTRPGNVRRRRSITRDHYYQPSRKLLTVYKEAERNAQKSREALRLPVANVG